MRHRRQKLAGPAATNAADEADPAGEVREVAAEESGNLRELATGVRDAVASPEHPPDAHHPAVDFGPVHVPPLTSAPHPPATSPGVWHTGHGAEAHGAQIAGLGLGLAMPLLGVIFAGLVERARRDALDYRQRYEAQQSRRRRLALDLAGLPTVVDPAVSFAPGSCSLIVLNSGEGLMVLPGGDPEMFRREHCEHLLAPFTARAWARLIPRQPWVRLTPLQADQIMAWTSKAGEHRPRRWPAIALLATTSPGGKPQGPVP
jgi:hypothetical protein